MTFCKEMKTILILLGFCTLLVAKPEVGKEAKIAWQSLKPVDLRQHVEPIKNFRDVIDLFGAPTSTGNNGVSSTTRYKFNDVFTLVFIGESRNDFRRDDDLRLVTSIFLFRNDADGHEIIWNLFKKVVADNSFRSDHLAQPDNKSKKQNKSEQATPRKPSD